MHSELCPVCHGKGVIYSPLLRKDVTCHGCNGKGWIEVKNDNYIPTIPYIPYPIPNPDTLNPYYTIRFTICSKN